MSRRSAMAGCNGRRDGRDWERMGCWEARGGSGPGANAERVDYQFIYLLGGRPKVCGPEGQPMSGPRVPAPGVKLCASVRAGPLAPLRNWARRVGIEVVGAGDCRTAAHGRTDCGPPGGSPRTQTRLNGETARPIGAAERFAIAPSPSPSHHLSAACSTALPNAPCLLLATTGRERLFLSHPAPAGSSGWLCSG